MSFKLQMLKPYAEEFQEIVPVVNIGDDSFGLDCRNLPFSGRTYS